jgi:hypothetical protein
MMDSSLSLIRFNTLNFFYTILNTQPFYPNITKLHKLLSSIISSENEPDMAMKKKLDWIWENTHGEIMQPLPVIELMVFRNLFGNLNREITIGDQDFYLIELYKILDEVIVELTAMVISISKKYSFEMPSTIQSSSGGFSFKDDSASLQT